MSARVAKKVSKKSAALAETNTSNSALGASSGTPTPEADELHCGIAIRYRIDDRIEALPLTTNDRSFYPFAAALALRGREP